MPIVEENTAIESYYFDFSRSWLLLQTLLCLLVGGMELAGVMTIFLDFHKV